MRMTKNEHILEAFANGNRKSAKVGNLQIEEGKLWNYNTVIAEYDINNNKIIVNETKYSVSTTRIVNKLKSFIPENNMILVSGFRMGIQTLK